MKVLCGLLLVIVIVFASSVGQVPNTAATYSCQILDNAICTSSVDSSGNPNFLATATGTSLPINGGTTPLVMFINGVYQNLNTNVTLTVPSTASVQQWILARQDTINANMVAADFAAMNTAPFYQYTAPTCPSPSPVLSSTNPSFWFNLATNLSELCTSNGGSYSPVASMVIGTVYVDATPKVLQVLTEPYRLNAYRRFEYFGNGSAGVLTVTSGTTTIDTHKMYQSVLITGGTLNCTPIVTLSTSTGVHFQSQSPVMISGTITCLGRPGTPGTTGAAAATNGETGFGGAGGGGGGSGTVSAAGALGGGRLSWINGSLPLGGGSAGTSAPTAGGNGVAATVLPPFIDYLFNGIGGAGAAGAGDAMNAGGSGGQAGGSIFVKCPSLLATSAASIISNGAVGSAGSGGNAGGGGGGGGGIVVLDAGFLSVSGATITASAGGAGAGSGTGQAGGTGGAGLVQENKLW